MPESNGKLPAYLRASPSFIFTAAPAVPLAAGATVNATTTTDSGLSAWTSVVEASARRLAGQDREEARLAALAWERWESTHISLDPNWQPGPLFDDERERMTFALLVTHYWANDGFLAGEQEIHGRRDISGPAITA